MDKIIDDVSKLCGVNQLLEKEPYTMSGGQKQKGAIAGVLALNPEILILDEATSMLDPKGKKEIMAVINDLKKINPSMTILSITHHIEEALNADEIIILDKGECFL